MLSYACVTEGSILLTLYILLKRIWKQSNIANTCIQYYIIYELCIINPLCCFYYDNMSIIKKAVMNFLSMFPMYF